VPPYEDIIARLEGLTGPDRKVDAAIHEAINPPLGARLRQGHIPSYTASLDAAIALVERQGFDLAQECMLLRFVMAQAMDKATATSQPLSYWLPIATLISLFRTLAARARQESAG
jgi:hypothetical protein